MPRLFGVRLLADGEAVTVWHARDSSEHFRLVVHPLAGSAGKRLQLELFDNDLGGWSHIMLDRVMLVQPQEAE